MQKDFFQRADRGKSEGRKIEAQAVHNVERACVSFSFVLLVHSPE